MGITCSLCSNHENQDLNVIKLKRIERSQTEKISPEYTNNSTEICPKKPSSQSTIPPPVQKPPLNKKPSKKLIDKRSKPRGSAFLNRTLISFYLLGPFHSGKTSFMNTFILGQSNSIPYKHSDSVETVEKRITYHNRSYDIRLTIPNKNLLSIKKNAESVDFFLLLYDMNDPNSFDQAESMFVNHLVNYQKGDMDKKGNVKLIGNKKDLERRVNKEKVERFCKENNIEEFEVSVMEGKSVENVVNKLVDVFDREVFNIGGNN